MDKKKNGRGGGNEKYMSQDILTTDGEVTPKQCLVVEARFTDNVEGMEEQAGETSSKVREVAVGELAD